MLRFAGAPLKGIAVRHERTTVRGEAVIAGYGLEGGAIYALSAAIRDATARQGRTVLTLDLKPDVTAETLTARLAAQPAKASLSNRLRKAAGLDPTAVALLREAGPLPETPDALAARIMAPTVNHRIRPVTPPMLTRDTIWPIRRLRRRAGSSAFSAYQPIMPAVIAVMAAMKPSSTASSVRSPQRSGSPRVLKCIG